MMMMTTTTTITHFLVSMLKMRRKRQKFSYSCRKQRRLNIISLKFSYRPGFASMAGVYPHKSSNFNYDNTLQWRNCHDNIIIYLYRRESNSHTVRSVVLTVRAPLISAFLYEFCTCERARVCVSVCEWLCLYTSIFSIPQLALFGLSLLISPMEIYSFIPALTHSLYACKHLAYFSFR